MPTITPFLWFNDNAEEAVNYYLSIFRDAQIFAVTRYGEAGPGPKGSVMTISFQLEGQNFTALNGGPVYTFSPGISFVVSCQTQAEVDRYYDQLAAGGQEHQCAWLTDKFGITWQIVPDLLIKLIQDKDPVKSQRVMKAMSQMKKIDLARLQEAYDQA